MELVDLSSRFELGPGLAQGRTGPAYSGVDRSSGAPVVVKLLVPLQGQAVLAQVVADLQAWIGYDHPHVASTLAVGQLGGHPAAVFQRVPGTTLAEMLEQGPVDPAIAVRIIGRVALALADAHDRGLACGDLRPGRIRCDSGGSILTGLGLARAPCAVGELAPLGLAFGHPSYLAPEAHPGGITSPTPATDIYALGVLLYQMLCGQLPFVASSFPVLLHMHREAPIPPPPLGANFSMTVASLTLRMTAKDPKLRFANGRALATAFEAVLKQVPAPAAAEAPPPPRPRSWAKATKSWSLDKIQSALPVGPPAAPKGRDVSDRLMLSAEMPAFPLEDMAAEVFELEEAPPAKAAPAGKAQPDTTSEEAEKGLALGEQLGRGSAGRCFAGTFAGRAVVVKALATAIQKLPEIRQRIVKRVAASRELSHPRVLKTLQIIKTPKRTMFVGERAKGRTLRAILDERGSLPHEEALPIVRQLAEALQAGEACGIGHGDLRPEKIFVDANGEVRLADFGLCEASCLGAGFGADGVPFGHPNYLAPEVIQERLDGPTPASDIYALGILFYELVCGAPPFQGPTTRDTLVMHLTKPMPSPRSTALPGPLAELITRMTVKNPSRRPESATELLEALALCAKQTELIASKADSSVDEFDPSATNVTENAWEDLVATYRAGKPKPQRKPASIAPPIKPKKMDSGLPRGVKLGALAVTLLALVGLGVVVLPGEDPPARREQTRRPTTPEVEPPPQDTSPRPEKPEKIVKPVVRRLSPLTPQPVRETHWPSPAPLQEDPRKAHELERHLADYESRVKDSIRRGKFREALELQRAHLDPKLVEKNTELADARVVALQRQVQEEYRKRRDEAKHELDEQLKRRRYRAAWKLAGEVEEWALEGSLSSSWKKRVGAELTAFTGPVKKLKAREIQVKSLENWLQGRLSGWKKGTSRVYENGGVVLCYEDLPALGKDLRLGSLEDEGEGLQIKAMGAALVLVHKLPLKRLLDASLEISVVRARKASEVALLVGVVRSSKKGPVGYGVAVDGTPVQLAPGKKLVRLTEGDEEPEATPLLSSLRLTVRVKGKQLQTIVEALDSGSKLRSQIGLEEVPGRGFVAVFVRGADVSVESLQVRGIADPKLEK